MKKLFKILGISLLVIILALALLPFLFKGKIIDVVKQTANDELNATLAFDDVSLSLFSDFPKLSVSIEALSLSNNAPFEGVELLNAKSINVSIDLFSLMGDEMKIKEIGLVEPNIDVRVLLDGSANYDIMKASESPEGAEETPQENEEAAAPFALNLSKYYIENGNISYSDETFPMVFKAKALNHQGSGDFTSDIFLLSTSTTIEETTFDYDGIAYLNKAKTDITADFDINMLESKYTFKENSTKVNNFEVAANGFVAIPGDDIEMDISFSAPNNDFKSLLSLIPAFYQEDMAGIETSGRIGFDGFVKGIYNEFTLPGMALNLRIDDGRLNYTDLPESIENIQVEAHIDASKGIDHDAMKIDIPVFHLDIAQNPVDLNFMLRTPYSDPFIDGKLKAKLDLSKIAQSIPLDQGDALAGLINADVQLTGNMSAIEEERYADFLADGQIIVQQFNYTSDSLDYPIAIKNAYLNFDPAHIELSAFDANLGLSDIQADGKFDNYMAYAFKDEALHGVFNLRSNTIDLNELMGEEESSEAAVSPDDTALENGETASADSSMSIIRLPKNIDFVLNSNIARLIYDDLDISKLKGSISMNEGVAALRGVEMEILDGKVRADGSYNSVPEVPTMNMDFGIQDMDIQKAVKSFYTIEKMAPIAKSCTGRFSTNMKMVGALNEQMEPITQSLSGGGKLSMAEVQIEKFAPLNKLAEELKIERLAKQSFKDVNISFEFADGRVFVEPFVVKLDGVPATISGSMSFEQEIDYDLDMDLPLDKIPGNLGQSAQGLLGAINGALGTSFSAGSTIPVNLKIGGTMTEPKIKSNFGEAMKGEQESVKENVKEAIKEEVKEQIEDLKEDAIAKAREEADKILADAQKEADSLVAQANVEAEELRSKGYAEADKLENKGANIIEKTANRKLAEAARKETDKKVQQAKDAAQKKADKIMADARKKADEKIAAAEAK